MPVMSAIPKDIIFLLEYATLINNFWNMKDQEKLNVSVRFSLIMELADLTSQNQEMKKTSSIFAIVVSSLIFFSQSCGATELILGGFTFSGEAGAVATRFPFTDEIFRQQANQKISVLTSQILTRSSQIRNVELTIAPSDKRISLRNTDEGLVTVLLMTGETILNERFDGYYKTFINLRADALIFDYKNKTIVRSYPLSVVLFDASLGTHPPSKQKILELISDMITRQDEKGLISQYINRMTNATLPNDSARTVQIANVEIESNAYEMFPAELRSDQSTIKDIIADSFSSTLSARVGISILPSKIGQAIGTMTFKLENSDDLIRLKIGDGDYLINLKLNKHAKIKKEETAVEMANIFAVSINLEIYEQMTNEYFVKSDFKNGEVAVSPISKVSGDDFPGFSASLNSLFRKVADAIKTDDLDWVKVSASNPNIKSEIKKIRQILQGT